jgi:FKBP-type peptidyl-prolyl cis-trans isomerase
MRVMLVAALLAVAAIVGATNPEGKKFLEENAKKEGVITLPSGLQYKVCGPTPSLTYLGIESRIRRVPPHS